MILAFLCCLTNGHAPAINMSKDTCYLSVIYLAQEHMLSAFIEAETALAAKC